MQRQRNKTMLLTVVYNKRQKTSNEKIDHLEIRWVAFNESFIA
jgi:hypothetical protein